MCSTVELQDKVATLESEVAVLNKCKSKALFLKDESFKLLKILTHKKFNNFPLSVLSFKFGIFFIGSFQGKPRLELLVMTMMSMVTMLIKYYLTLVLVILVHIIMLCFLNSPIFCPYR